MPPQARPLPHASQPPLPAWPQVDAGTLHRLLLRVARRFGLSAEHQAKLAARGYEVADCGPESRHVFASLPADKAVRVALANWLLSDAYTRTTEADLLGVHGFQRQGTSPRALVTFLPWVDGSALLEFARDEQGRLIGFQYAPDAPKSRQARQIGEAPHAAGLLHGRALPHRTAQRRCGHRLLAHRGHPQGQPHG